jgi:hypothetical protein
MSEITQLLPPTQPQPFHANKRVKLATRQGQQTKGVSLRKNKTARRLKVYTNHTVAAKKRKKKCNTQQCFGSQHHSHAAIPPPSFPHPVPITKQTILFDFQFLFFLFYPTTQTQP